MTCCAYCGEAATISIAANPSRVCLDHAVEFWTGLLAYAHAPDEPCVKNQRECDCPRCEALWRGALRRAAIASAGPAPGDHTHPARTLASSRRRSVVQHDSKQGVVDLQTV